jgi:NAD-dependent DNA ligase (contains BRCT domain type II)
MNELIQQKIRQYLVHSFLYYQLDESIISDRHYDHICADVAEFISDNSARNSLPFHDLVKSSLTENASGFSIRKYPPEIVSAALHLLYQTSYIDTMSFEIFLTRFGYSSYEIRNA